MSADPEAEPINKPEGEDAKKDGEEEEEDRDNWCTCK